MSVCGAFKKGLKSFGNKAAVNGRIRSKLKLKKEGACWEALKVITL